MSRRKFDDLVPVFAASYDAAQQEWVESSSGARIQGCDTKETLDSPEKRLFFILYYLNNLPSFDALGCFFGLSSSYAYDHMILYMQALRRGLEILAVAPNRALRFD